MNSPEQQPGFFLLTDKIRAEESCEEVFFNRGGINHNKIHNTNTIIIIQDNNMSYCVVSWCPVSVVINIHYDRNAKNPSFHLVIDVPIWSISSLYLSSLQGCRLSLFYFGTHTKTHTLMLSLSNTQTHFFKYAWNLERQLGFTDRQRNTAAEFVWVWYFFKGKNLKHINKNSAEQLLIIYVCF